jgi:RNA polymerase sigma-70 factor (ECF subfamily)
LPDFKWQGVSVKSWIFTIARNAIIDYYRKFDKEKNNVSLEEVSTNFKSGSKDILVNLLDGEEDKKLYLEISKLKEKDQFLIYYKYFEELSIKEIAKRVSMSESNVATRLHRLRKKILKSMK